MPESADFRILQRTIMHGWQERCMQGFDGKPEEKRLIWSPIRRWDNIIDIYFQEMWQYDGEVNLMNLAQSRKMWRSLAVMIMKLFLILRRHYIPMQTFPWLIFSQSALFFGLSSQFVILHLLISVCTQLHHLFFSRTLRRLPWGLLLNTWLTFLSPSILLTWQIQFNRLLLTNESKSKSPNSYINSSLHHFFQK